MPRSRSLISLVLLLVLAAIVSVYVLREIWGPAEPDQAAASVAAAEAATPALSTPQYLAPARATGNPPPTPTIRRRFDESGDYLEFVRSIHAAAQAGDAEAQYYLSSALDDCIGNHAVYFGAKGHERSYEEGLRRAARLGPPLSVEEGQAVYSRCHELIATGPDAFGEREQWLQSAALGGQPRAQAEYAGKLLVLTNNLPPAEVAATREDARGLLRKALTSQDPEVIDAVAMLASLRHNVGDADRDVIAWTLAACARGLDCSATGRRMKELCSFDPGCQGYESVEDFFRRYLPDFPLMESRALEINRLIDAQDWGALGLASPASP